MCTRNSYKKLAAATINNWSIEKHSPNGLIWESFCNVTREWAASAGYSKRQIARALAKTNKLN